MSIYNQDVFVKRLRTLMDDNGDNNYTLAEYLKLSPPTISRYLTKQMNPKSSAIEMLSLKYNVNPAWLMGADVEKYLYPQEVYIKIPIIGVIAAGAPIYAVENTLGYEYVEQSEHVNFCLKVKGDSMIGARIYDGDIVFIREQPDVENGEIAAVIIDGEEATLKRVYKMDGAIVLRAENPIYKDMVFSRKEAKTVKIIGKAISFKSNLL